MNTLGGIQRNAQNTPGGYAGPTMSYTLSTTVALPLRRGRRATRAALADQGFGILTEIDLAPR